MFELSTVTQVTVTNANPRRELHGEERVRAIDLSFSLKGENTLLDLIQPGLREHHYCNQSLKAGQESLPEMIIPLPNLRYPRLPTTYHFAKGEKWRGYRFIWDYGLEDAKFDFQDFVLTNLHYDIAEGGSCTLYWTIQYNGDELQNNITYGELSGLASEGDIHIMLLAPADIMLAKKGYRAGQPDTPPPPASDEGQGELEVGDFDPNTPEGALAGALAKD